MHKRILTAMTVLISVLGCADTIAPDIAEQVVKSWAQTNESLYKSFPSELESITSFKGRKLDYYLAQFKGGGWVVLSSDDNLTPVIAYSMTGEFVLNNSNPVYAMLTSKTNTAIDPNQESATETMQYNVGMIEGIDNILTNEYKKSIYSDTNKSRWSRLRYKSQSTNAVHTLKATTRASSITDPVVDPLLKTKWGQGSVATGPCYNYYTPSNYPCGCVATAMAQIMRYHEWPKEKVDLVRSYSAHYENLDKESIPWTVSEDEVSDIFADLPFGGPYIWNKMVFIPDQLTPSDIDEEDSRKAIGQLARDCGITMQANYTPGGTGAYGSMIPSVLVNQFGYTSGLLRTFGEIPIRETLMAMLSSFDAKLPCVLTIPGHCIVADGYGYSDGRLYIHLNYGWAGASDAWYAPPESDEDETDYPSVSAVGYNIWTPSKCPDANRTIVSGRVLTAEFNTGVTNVTIIASNVVSTATFETVTDGRGVYAFFLPPGEEYKIYINGSPADSMCAYIHTMPSRGNRSDYGVIWSGGSVQNIPSVDIYADAFSPSSNNISIMFRASFNEGEERLLVKGRGFTHCPNVINPGPDAEFKDNKVYLKGGTNSTSGLDFGTINPKMYKTSIGGGPAVKFNGVTIETWAREDDTRNWSRILECGSSKSNTFLLAWTSGTSIPYDHCEIYQDNNRQYNERGCGPYEPGKWYHISVTFEQPLHVIPQPYSLVQSNYMNVRFCKRNAETGELINSGMLTQALPNELSDARLYIGRSNWEADNDACATYDEVRVWAGCANEEQLRYSCLAGPDKLANNGYLMPTGNNYYNPTTYKEIESPSIIPHPITRRAHHYNYDRYSKHAYELTTVIQGIEQYTEVKSGVSLKELYRSSIDQPSPSFLKQSTLRYEGTFYVPKSDAGVWKFIEGFDDHVCFWIDSNLILYNHTYKDVATMTANISPGWHAFTFVVGDAFGGYGSSYKYGDIYVPMVVSINQREPAPFDEDHFYITTTWPRSCFVDERMSTSGTTGSWKVNDEDFLSPWNLNTSWREVSSSDIGVAFSWEVLRNKLITVIETEVSGGLNETITDLFMPGEGTKSAVTFTEDGSAAVLTKIGRERKWVAADVKGVTVNDKDPYTLRMHINQLAMVASCEIVDKNGNVGTVVVRDTKSQYWPLATINRDAPKEVRFYGDGKVKRIYGKGDYTSSALIVE